MSKRDAKSCKKQRTVWIFSIFPGRCWQRCIRLYTYEVKASKRCRSSHWALRTAQKDHSLTSCACVYFAGGTAQRDSRVHNGKKCKKQGVENILVEIVLPPILPQQSMCTSQNLIHELNWSVIKPVLSRCSTMNIDFSLLLVLFNQIHL